MKRHVKIFRHCSHITISRILFIVLLIASTLANAKPSPSPKPTFQSTLSSQSDFNKLSRTYYRGRFYALPHLMFVVDRSQQTVYFIDSHRYSYHEKFMWAEHLTTSKGEAFFVPHYVQENRRFVLGTLAYQKDTQQFSIEFWEGDRLTSTLLEDAYKLITAHFFAPIFFKSNSLLHDKVITTVNQSKTEDQRIPVLDSARLYRNKPYLPVHLGKAVGKLKIIRGLSENAVIYRDEIVIFTEIPLKVLPLRGIITTTPSSPLSHLSLLAGTWKIPNASIQNADSHFANLEGRYIHFEANENTYTLTPASNAEIQTLKNELQIRAKQVTPKADLTVKTLTNLKDQRAADANQFGSKSANLGELIHAHSSKFQVPPGFTIPFSFYTDFIRENGLEPLIRALLQDDHFLRDVNFRKEKLKELREKIQQGSLSESFQKKVLEKVRQEYLNKGLFVRSSTNAEDLPHFSGAGLYATVANAKTDSQILEGIKTVWASVWSFEAFEAREAFGMNHLKVYPAVILQEGLRADSAGVAITTNPFNPLDADVVYISANQGLGIKTVEGKRIPEQFLYEPRSNSIRLLTHSEEENRLIFDDQGGVKAVPLHPQKTVLDEEKVWKIIRTAQDVERIFAGRFQDIEWVFVGGELFVVQARPYLN